MSELLVDALVPFSTRLADDGLLHVRAWRADGGAVAVVSELDWPIQVADRDDGYSGPGLFNYPHYALPAALSACEAAGVDAPQLIARIPAPPGERFLLVTDPDDPQDWTPLDVEQVAERAGLRDWPGPAPGEYHARGVASRIAAGG